ncbi:MAG: TonB family protein [Bacteroidetes bacterium]|jgi:protein TonB|nr:TonB family protein [Bacteroidota bacterium]
MKSSRDNNQNWEEFLFAFKNKEYGAFQTRKRLNKILLLALGTGIFIIITGYSSPLLYSWLQGKDREQTEVVPVKLTTQTELMSPPPVLPDEPPPPPPEKVPKKVATKRFVKPEIRPDEEVIEEELPPTVKDLETAAPSTQTQEGTADIFQDYVIPVVENEPEPEPEPEPKEEEVYTYVQSWPEFPGGNTAMFKFIGENLKYPASASDAGIHGTVFVQFVVSKDGNIKDVEVLRGIGGGCDEAAMNVIKKMPAWKPGHQNDVAVAVRYNIPIRFILEE